MQRFGIPCQFQVYVVNNLSYRNVICSLDTQAKTKMVMGAHYDVFSARNGADNNASGVAGLLETARLLALQKSKLKHDVEFAFYTLEEPPFFRTVHMGSYMHAKSLKKQKQKIKGVVILDSIGYFDEHQVQSYPVRIKVDLSTTWLTFIAAIGHLASTGLTGDYCDAMQRFNRLECRTLC